MTTKPVAVGDPALSTELSFDRTIDRGLVHRAAVAEVFVTDMVPIGPARFLAAAQLPLMHGYYSDHVQRPPLFDPLLVLEAGRQAGIGGAHLTGLPADTVLLVNMFSLRLPNLPGLVVGQRPGELRIDNRFEASRVRRGRVRRGSVQQELYVGDQYVGTHTMEVQVVTHSEHEVLRNAVRGTPAPSTAELADLPHERQAAPHQVGRTNPLNVAIADVVREAGTVSARVAPRFGNRALFDHSYDHLPAMALTEAARQLALVAVDDGTGQTVPRAQLTEVTGTFWRFAELDRPAVATAALSGADDAVTAAIRFAQDSATIAESTVTLVPAPSSGAAR
jgi:hypothetical protein